MSEIQKPPGVKNLGKNTNREMISTVFFNVYSGEYIFDQGDFQSFTALLSW